MVLKDRKCGVKSRCHWR